MKRVPKSRPIWRGVAVLAVAMLAAGALAITPATAGKFATKKWVKKYTNANFAKKSDVYTKSQADDRFSERLFAVVSDTGSLVRGHGATAAVLDSTGGYLVTFDRNVSACAWVATLQGASGEISVDSIPNPAVVNVETRDSAGAFTNAPFHLVVVC